MASNNEKKEIVDFGKFYEKRQSKNQTEYKASKFSTFSRILKSRKTRMVISIIVIIVCLSFFVLNLKKIYKYRIIDYSKQTAAISK